MPLNTTNEYVVSHLSKGPSLVPTRQILTPVLDFCCPEASGFDRISYKFHFACDCEQTRCFHGCVLITDGCSEAHEAKEVGLPGSSSPNFGLGLH